MFRVVSPIMGCEFAGHRIYPPQKPMPRTFSFLHQICQSRKETAKTVPGLAKNLLRTIQVNGGTDPPSNIQQTLLAKQIVVRVSSKCGGGDVYTA